MGFNGQSPIGSSDQTFFGTSIFQRKRKCWEKLTQPTLSVANSTFRQSGITTFSDCSRAVKGVVRLKRFVREFKRTPTRNKPNLQIVKKEKMRHQGRGKTMDSLRANGIRIVGCGNVASPHIYRRVHRRRYRGTTEVQQLAGLADQFNNRRVHECTPNIYSRQTTYAPTKMQSGNKFL